LAYDDHEYLKDVHFNEHIDFDCNSKIIKKKKETKLDVVP
jgi:hypothetical protein